MCRNESADVQSFYSEFWVGFDCSASIEYINPLVAPIPFLTGSSLGFRNFFTGGSDVASASRPIRDTDYSAAGCPIEDFPNVECNGRLAAEVSIGVDKLAIIANDDLIASSSAISGNPPDISNGALRQLVINANNNGIAEGFIPDFQSGTFDFFIVS